MKMSLIEVLLLLAITMVNVRYAVAGEPITHSLSPLIFALVHESLGGSGGEACPDSRSVTVIPAAVIENALAWGYAGILPNTPDWQLVGSPLGKFRANTLLERAVIAAMAIEEADPRLPECQSPTALSEIMPKGTEDVWLSLTTPLKHQLSKAAVKTHDNSMEISSVNSLRWDGLNWWAATTDGLGFLVVAQAFGYSPTKDILGLSGGGSTARSFAETWSTNGGKVVQLPCRRPLDKEGPWNLVKGKPTFVVDLDLEPQENSDRGFKVTYRPMSGDVDSRIEHLSKIADGRWLLCAQHLQSWAKLWSPECTPYLPSLELLMTRLVYAEAHLDS